METKNLATKKDIGTLRDEMQGMKSDMKTLKENAKRHEKGIDKILEELGNIRKDNREFLQMRNQLYSNDLVQERKIDNLEERVHHLEIAK